MASPELAVPIALARPIPLGMLGDVRAIVGATASVVDVLPAGTAEHAAAGIIPAHGLFAVDEAEARAGLPDRVDDATLTAGLSLDPSFCLHVERVFGYAERSDEAAAALLMVIATARAARARSSLAMAFGALADVRLRSGRFDEVRAVLAELESAPIRHATRWSRAAIEGMRGMVIAGADPGN